MKDKKENIMKKKSLIPNEGKIEKAKKALYREMAKRGYESILEYFSYAPKAIREKKELTNSQFNIICSYIYDNYIFDKVACYDFFYFPRLDIYCEGLFYRVLRKLPKKYTTRDIENKLEKLTCGEIIDYREDFFENDYYWRYPGVDDYDEENQE
jgi:hypothetical protein